MDDRGRHIEQWYHLPVIAGTIFTLVGIHYLHLIPLFVGAVIVSVLADVVKFVWVSPYNFLYLSIGHGFVGWAWVLGTSAYFFVGGDWLRGVYAIAYMLVLGTVAGLPSQLASDFLFIRQLGMHPKHFAAARLDERYAQADLEAHLKELQVEHRRWMRGMERARRAAEAARRAAVGKEGGGRGEG